LDAPEGGNGVEELYEMPAEIREASFPLALRGYSCEAVDAYVKRVIAELEVQRSPRAAVRQALDRVGEQVGGDRAVEPRPARVPGERRGQHVVPALERGQHELPRPPRVGEAVQADQRFPGAAAVRCGEDRRQVAVSPRPRRRVRSRSARRPRRMALGRRR